MTSMLLVLFFAGLGALWYADYARVPSRLDRQNMANRLLPELMDVPLNEIIKLEIDRANADDSIVLEHGESGRWQMIKPVDTAADSETADTLLRTIKDLGKSVDAGTIDGDPSKYGLGTPKATIKIYVKDRKEPVVLDVGESTRERCYVRPGGEAGIEVVDARLLSPAVRKAYEWRDTTMFRIPSFKVESVTVDEAEPNRQIKVKRDERHWKLLKPFETPADDDKVEGLVAEASALRVVDRSEDFIEDNVKDLAKYGLDTPWWKVTLEPFPNSGKAQVVLFGKSVPGKPDSRYAMRSDQDDVVSVDFKRLRDAVPGPNGLRSQKVLDFVPGRVSKIQIDAPGSVFTLHKNTAGWELSSPVAGLADGAAVQSLLSKLSELKASEFLDPARVVDPRLESPSFRVRLWQTDRPAIGTPSKTPGSSEGMIKVDLKLGRIDSLKKSVYGRIEGDATVLAFPDEVLKELPRNAFAYRDRTLLKLKPEQITSVTIERPGSTVTVVPNGLSDKGMKSRMIAPVDAPTDEASVTSLLLALANLRAESWVSDTIPDPAAYGFDAPFLRVKWGLQKGSAVQAGALRIARPRSRVVQFLANLEGDSRVFVLNPGVVAALEAELHDRAVFNFKPESVDRVTLEWPSRTLALVGTPRPASTSSWAVEPGYDATRFDFSAVNPLVAFFSNLKTSRYFQYEGPIQDEAGLDLPRLSLRIGFVENLPDLVLRIGNSRPDGTCFATTAEGPSGPVFLFVPDEPMKALLRPPGRSTDLPDDPFAPTSTAAPSRP